MERSDAMRGSGPVPQSESPSGILQNVTLYRKFSPLLVSGSGHISRAEKKVMSSTVTDEWFTRPGMSGEGRGGEGRGGEGRGGEGKRERGEANGCVS